MPRSCVCVLCRHRAGILTSYPHHDSHQWAPLFHAPGLAVFETEDSMVASSLEFSWKLRESAGRHEPSSNGTLDRDARPPNHDLCKNYSVNITLLCLFCHTSPPVLSMTWEPGLGIYPDCQSPKTVGETRCFRFLCARAAAPTAPEMYSCVRTTRPVQSVSRGTFCTYNDRRPRRHELLAKC